MAYKKEVCEICLQPISHPICSECYLKHVEYWLRDLNKEIDDRAFLGRVKKAISKDSLNETECVVCGKKEVSMCSYCTFLRMSRVLVKLDFETKEKENFEEIFNHNIDEYPLSA